MFRISIRGDVVMNKRQERMIWRRLTDRLVYVQSGPAELALLEYTFEQMIATSMGTADAGPLLSHIYAVRSPMTAEEQQVVAEMTREILTRAADVAGRWRVVEVIQ